jgi:hypothetical protein
MNKALIPLAEMTMFLEKNYMMKMEVALGRREAARKQFLEQHVSSIEDSTGKIISHGISSKANKISLTKGGLPILSDKPAELTKEQGLEQIFKVAERNVSKELKLAKESSEKEIKIRQDVLDDRIAENKLLETQLTNFNIAKERLTLNSTNFALAQLDREVEGYAKLVKQGKLDAAELEKFRIDSVQRIQAQNSVMWTNMIQAANRFSDDLSDTFADWVETGKFSFQSTATDFARMVNKMVFQLLVIQPLMDTLFGSAGGGNATGLGIVGNFLFPKQAAQTKAQTQAQTNAVKNFTKMFNGETGEMFDKFAKDKKGMDKMFEDNMKGLADIAETTAKDMNKGFDSGLHFLVLFLGHSPH